ncbi:ABC-F family ATP-binding cassette domain-containing protein [Roseimicrobium sp. ORNL1]|uniref:ABC-F family ATP-binding cassette domain-containing protein n=1 Tax=Roseimicrobium sp. ORNL1 TaxID=2711231 RepID=UPI0013E11B62|nr:ABC-F family ATP-binding cassette domain-containing protein [Roseimicrobium sp. ORNL1]QIF00654.1 ABC-F family ATP-binding cassette domain-containing protein [Roseimicrobium sp. ORNL1]
MLAAENLGISYGPRRLFGGLNFTLRAGERVALAGPNGAGKSTLLKMIAGIEQQDEGRFIKAKAVEIGYLPQEGVEIKGRTLMAEAETAFEGALQLQRELDETSELLGQLSHESPEYADALEVFGDLQLRLEHHDISTMKPRIERVLVGLGFSHADMDRLTDEFSGGWQMRIALAKLLLAEPSVLLLDEPTNHLDIESVVWLEDYMKSYHGAVLLISHDRQFLDNLTNRTLAFESGKVNLYSGNYSFYVRESTARREQLERAKKNQDREIAKTQAFIDRFRAQATKASQAQSRIKMLDKIERIELEDTEDEIGFNFPQPPPSGHTVVRMEGISKTYDGTKLILKPFDFEITKGDRIAIVGVNGAGKTTFSKIAAGVEKATGGTRELGHHVRIGYYSQDHADSLDGTKTVLQTIEKNAKGLSEAQLRTLLGCFLFRGDDAFKSVKVLSGGERGRLALANMLLTPANFLVLDEPTNHLDMRSQGVLQQALTDYTGTYLIVSHNRAFLDPIVNKTLEFRVGEPPRLYLGNLSYYLTKKAEEKARGYQPAPLTTAAPPPTPRPGAEVDTVNAKERRRLEAQRRQEKTRTLKPLQEQLEKVEATISNLESEKAALTKKMAGEGFGEDAGEVVETTSRFGAVEHALERAFSQWSTLSEEIERAEKKFGDV